MLGCSVESEPLCYHWMVPETWWGSISWLFHLEPPSSGLKTKRSLTPLPENPELTHPSPVPWLLTQSDCSSLQIASGWATQSHSHSHKSRQTKQTYTDMSTVTHQHSGISYKNKHELLFFFFYWKQLFDPKEQLRPLEQTFTFGFNLPSMTASEVQFSPFSFWHPPLEKNSPTMLAPCSVWKKILGPHFTFERHTFFKPKHA